jgi:hypothetical protein
MSHGCVVQAWATVGHAWAIRENTGAIYGAAFHLLADFRCERLNRLRVPRMSEVGEALRHQ